MGERDQPYDEEEMRRELDGGSRPNGGAVEHATPEQLFAQGY